jgi:hypothetical protein
VTTCSSRWSSARSSPAGQGDPAYRGMKFLVDAIMAPVTIRQLVARGALTALSQVPGLCLPWLPRARGAPDETVNRGDSRSFTG